jgi:asparagine synthase (glutamine-hydrolysing)
VKWSNALDALMASASLPLELDERYIAGWLRSFPAADLSPYRGIAAVPPGCLVRIYRGTPLVSRFWEFNQDVRIKYRHDRDYETHFRWLFRQSVARRLRASGPVLAELSGGVDSSSIVCMADLSMKQGFAHIPALNTISYYDDSEPNWNERKNFSKIEEVRGRVGIHVDCAKTRDGLFNFQTERLAAIPADAANGSDEVQQILKCFAEQGHRVLLSGIAGDEMLGGVPTPLPELEDLLVRGKLGAFFRQLGRWASLTRKPALGLLGEVLARLLPTSVLRADEADGMPWLDPGFRRRNQNIFSSEQQRIRLTGAPPAFQENLETLNFLRRQLGSQPVPQEPAYEKRYPYLDRDLLEFVFAIPREQIVRPGDRRSLMRRALSGIVPAEVLYQKRKAFAVRGPVQAVIGATEALLDGGGENLLSASLGFVAPQPLAKTISALRSGESTRIVPLIRVLALEGWLRNLCHHGMVSMTPRALRRRACQPIASGDQLNPPGTLISQLRRER